MTRAEHLAKVKHFEAWIKTMNDLELQRLYDCKFGQSETEQGDMLWADKAQALHEEMIERELR
jgi:hypothetical protein